VEVRGRSVLLTGATGGIGRAAALRLARAGARLTLVARREEPLRALASEISAVGGEAIAVPADVTVAADGARAVAEAVQRFQGLDALINNAGVGYLRAIDEATEAEIEEMVSSTSSA
jgi:NADP-dependent 3-hydroxy acid dehydrogenase YdfG